MMEHYYHLFANGDDAKNFITGEEEFRAALNRIAVCSHLCNIIVLAMSIEDTHPHVLLKGSYESAQDFKEKYIDLSIRYMARHRGSADDVILQFEICPITDESYLMNAASYVIVQPTKDGKAVLPYDYLYGSGALYFRKPGTILPWDHDYKGHLYERKKLGSLPIRKQWKICNTKAVMPQEWVIVNGFIHPDCYVDIAGFEKIFRTHNCFRAFMSSGKARDEIVRRTMSEVRGVSLEDFEARKICEECCGKLFGKRTTRHLTTAQRLILAQSLRKEYLLSFRQLATLCKLPESEIRKYVK